MKPAFGLFLVLLSCIASVSQSTTPRQTKSVGKAGAPKANSLPAETIPHAEWTEGVESIVGLTREQFSEAGLARLTRDEYKELLLAVYNNREKAVKNALAAQMKYQCGPIPQTYDRVKVYVEISTATTP